MKHVLLLLFSVYCYVDASEPSSSSSSSKSTSSSTTSSISSDTRDKYIRSLIVLTKHLDIQDETFPDAFLSYRKQCADYGKKEDHNPVVLQELQKALGVQQGHWARRFEGVHEGHPSHYWTDKLP